MQLNLSIISLYISTNANKWFTTSISLARIIPYQNCLEQIHLSWLWIQSIQSVQSVAGVETVCTLRIFSYGRRYAQKLRLVVKGIYYLYDIVRVFCYLVNSFMFCLFICSCKVFVCWVLDKLKVSEDCGIYKKRKKWNTHYQIIFKKKFFFVDIVCWAWVSNKI